MRIAKNLLIQPVENNPGGKPDVVVLDEATGSEVLIPADLIPRALAALDYFGGTNLRPVVPGDLVENIAHPELDYRIVLSTGIQQDDDEYVEHGQDYVTLEFPGGESPHMPATLYRTVKPRDDAELDLL